MKTTILIIAVILITVMLILIGMLIGVNLFYKKLINKSEMAYLNDNVLELSYKKIFITLKVLGISANKKEEEK